MRTLLSLLTVLALGYAVLLVAVYVMQPRLLYLPRLAGMPAGETPRAIGLAYEEVWIDTADGVRLHAWYVPADPARGTLLFFHGNAGHIGHRLESIAQFHSLGLNVLIVDYRGYGESEGAPTEAGTYADAAAAWDYLMETRGIAADRIVLFGRSLGAAVAARLATGVTPAGLIIESAFTSVPDVAAKYYWYLPVRLLSRFQYDTRAALAEVACPLLVIHSRHDEIIPFEHGEALYAAGREPKTFLEITGGHNDGFFLSNDRYLGGIDKFLASVLP